MYNYLDAMREDVLQAIQDNYTISDYSGRDELESTLNDDLWIDDGVTGNASGSYTMNAATAREYVMDNEELLQESIREFCTDAVTIANHFMNGDWEWFDVTIRCYLLGQAISAALDEIEFDEEEDEDKETA